MEKSITREWLSYSEAQQYAGIGRTKLWELLNAGEIRAAHVGKAVRISRQSLESYMLRNAYSQATEVEGET